MSWVKTDDLLPHHRKIMAAGRHALAVLGLYQAGNAFCQRHFSDGVIRPADLPLLCPAVPKPSKALLALMVQVGLWDPLPDASGWCVHDWLDHNDSAAVRRAKLAADSARKRGIVPNGIRTERKRIPRGIRTESKRSSSPLLSTPLREAPKEEQTPPPSPPSAAGAAGATAQPDSVLESRNGHPAWPSPEALVARYNAETPEECPFVETLSAGRRAKARQYLTAFPDPGWWGEVFRQIHGSAFLRGHRKRPGHEHFVADFDWLLSKGKDGSENAVKVHDGRYQD